MSDNLSTSEQSTSFEDKLSTADDIAEINAQALLEPANFEDGNAFFAAHGGANIMTTDGGNDTEPEEENGDDAAPAGESKKANKTSPKKRTATNTEEDGSPKKKRAPVKGKAANENSDGETETSPKKKGRRTKAKAAAAKQKTESTDDDAAKASENEETANVKPEESQGGETERPMTPDSQVIKQPKTPKTPKSPNVVPAAEAVTPKAGKAKTHPKAKPSPKPSPVKGKRQAADKVADKVPLPPKWSEAGPADRMLVEWKEAGKPWSEIRVKWLEMTGQDTATSTLPNLIRMELQDGEKDTLIAAKEAVEANWKATMWAAISSKMEEMGAGKYPGDFLAKEYKKLEAEQTSAVNDDTTTGNTGVPSTKATATNGNTKAKGKNTSGANVLLAAAAEALADGSDDAEEEAEEEEAAEE
ncbi:MAG: hypothetical protein Q9166_007598 [cf. Caloplaca sp. 2 TL-2023]